MTHRTDNRDQTIKKSLKNFVLYGAMKKICKINQLLFFGNKNYFLILHRDINYLPGIFKSSLSMTTKDWDWDPLPLSKSDNGESFIFPSCASPRPVTVDIFTYIDIK
jgi:hypothetical protein